MKRNPGFILRVVMLVVDLLVVVAAFAVAYYSRVYFDPRPYYFTPDVWEFLQTLIFLLPMWLLVLFISGVYRESNYLYRSKTWSRLLLASGIGTICMVAAAFFLEIEVFPSRVVVVYAWLLSFLFLLVEREIIRFVRKKLLARNRGVLNAIVIGNDSNTPILLEQLASNKHFGYRAVAVVAKDEFVPKSYQEMKYRSLSAALKTNNADVIIQTDEEDTSKVYGAAVDHHMGYLFVPVEEILLSRMSKMQIVGTTPMISVSTTPLVGWSRFVKRLCDLVFGIVLFAIASPFMLVIWIMEMCSGGNPIYVTKRLSRFNRKVKIYKFRSHKKEYSGLMPEEAFAKMGKPELAKQYRANGDKLDDDPRVSHLGKFLRATSLDELPQFINVIRGDISLVGPRALVPGELEKYPSKHLILSAKSGLTGLAQVSGRRNISFEERRSLDIYYIQNWSLWLDIQIILRTVLMVLTRRGAK